jgi:alpha-tubulin suppressor-like RCC1 family protein
MKFKFKSFGAIIFALSVICTSVNAFVPGGWKALAPGDHHTRIVNEALDEIYAEYGYGPGGISYTNTMKSVRDTMANANAEVDEEKKTNAEWHCDGEQLTQCSNLVKSETAEGVDKILSGNMDGARDTIGAATHPLQDFYAHSNWVEMHGSVVNDEMGYGAISNVAGANENTCEYVGIPPFTPPMIACSLMNDDNIVTTKLTSGYFLDTSGAPPAGVKKCFHGGSWDGLGSEGINKDSSVCFLSTGIGAGVVISPHDDSHKPAADAAKAATVKYFKSIKDTLISKKGAKEGDAAFKQFLGFGPALGFAIDTTGSMGEEINGVKSAVSQMVKSRIGTSEEPSLYVLSIINDPALPGYIKTTSSDTFLSTLSILYAGYLGNGGDCPEMSGFGTYQAASALITGSNLFVYTDASIKDTGAMTVAALLANEKNIRVNSALSGHCSPYDPGYFTIADMTGGQVFIISRYEAGVLAQLSDILIDSYYAGLLSIGGKLTSADNNSYAFKVDSKTDRISVSISIISGSATVSIVRPDGSIVEAGDPEAKRTILSSAIVYDIKNPDIGTWRVNIQGDSEFTVNAAASSPLSFDSFKFVKYGGRTAHEGFFEIEGFPITGSTSAVEATLSDTTSDVRFELRSKSGGLIEALTLDVVDEYPKVKTVFFKEDFIVPDEDFVVYAFGKDENGAEFQRVLSKKIAPQTVSVTAPSDKEIPLDADTIYTFRVTNHAQSENFNFIATDNRGYVVDIKPANAVIEKDGYIDVNVTLNPRGDKSAVGEKITLTFLAYPASGKRFGNYAVAEGIVTDAKPKSMLFKGSLITTGATIDENGDVYVWGFRGSGQQGNGKLSVSSSKSAAKVESLSNIAELTGGAYHLIALDANGDVWGWGQSGYGESGCKHTTGIYVDTPCKVISNIIQVAAGEYFTIALDNEGNVYTWGHNLYGQLGIGNSKNSQTPILVNLNGEKARLIGAAYEGAFAVTEDGHVYAWGDNEASGLGFKGTNYGVQKIVRTPTHVTNLDKYANDIVYIAGGNGWGEALLNDGTVIGWGLEAALGQGTTKTSLSSPEPVVILHNIKQLFARYVGSIALSDDGVIYTWGQTGGSAFKHIYAEFAAPHDVNGEVIEIGGGKEHIFYKTSDGSLYGVGYNDLYKLNLDRLGGIIQWNGEKIGYK